MLKLCKIHACPNGTLGLHLSRAPWDPYPWISGVQDGSNAHQAGVRTGDAVLELNGSDVLGQKISEMAMKIQSHWAAGGSFVTLLIWRNKTENNAVNQQSLQKFAKCLQQIAQLLECPICLEIVKPPGWQCCNGHVLCNSCRGRTVKCPICRVTLGPRGRCLLSDKLFTLLAESFPCDGVKNGNSPSTYNDCHEKPLISVKIDRPPTSASSSPTSDKVHHRKQIPGNTILGHLKKSDDDNSQLAADDNSTSPDDNIVVLKLNLKSQKKSDFMEHGSCHHRHHHQQQEKQQQEQLYHHHHSQSHHGRQMLGQQQQITFHCPTGKSSCFLLHNATDDSITASNNFRPDPDTKTLNCIWTAQEVPFRKSKGEEKIETLAKLITEWDVLSHLTQVHQISVAQHYTTFGQPVRLQFAVNTKSMPCITIQSERTCTRNKENFKNNVNVSVGGVFLPTEGTEKVQGHTFDGRHKNARMTNVPKNVNRPATELFFVACIPMDSDEDMEMCVHQEGMRNEMNDVSADTRGDAPPPPTCLAHEFDDAAGALPVFVGFPNGKSAGAGVITTATESKSTRESTYSQTTGHLIQDPGSEFPSTTWQSRVNVERSSVSSGCVCTNSLKGDACTWCTSSSSSSSSSLSCSSSLASFSMSSSSYRCCSNTMTRQHAIFIWYFGSECDVKNFQTVIECKRTGLKWTGCVHPLTKSWSSIRRAPHMQQFLVLNSMPDGGDNFFDIVIKIK